MTSIITTTYCGYCPHIDADRQIVVELFAFDVARSMSKHYRKRSFICPDSDECRFASEGEFCPPARNAPTHP